MVSIRKSSSNVSIQNRLEAIWGNSLSSYHRNTLNSSNARACFNVLSPDNEIKISMFLAFHVCSQFIGRSASCSVFAALPSSICPIYLPSRQCRSWRWKVYLARPPAVPIQISIKSEPLLNRRAAFQCRALNAALPMQCFPMNHSRASSVVYYLRTFFWGFIAVSNRACSCGLQKECASYSKMVGEDRSVLLSPLVETRYLYLSPNFTLIYD